MEQKSARCQASGVQDWKVQEILTLKKKSFREKMSRQPTRMADSKKVSGELFSLTYGALVAQIVKVV